MLKQLACLLFAVLDDYNLGLKEVMTLLTIDVALRCAAPRCSLVPRLCLPLVALTPAFSGSNCCPSPCSGRERERGSESVT